MEDHIELKKLEESMWRAETRFDKEYLERMLAPDFFEFGRSGKVYNREQIINTPAQEIKADLPLKSFEVKKITNDVVLLTYISEVQYEELEVANRSSIWSKTADEWKMRFHQGTPILKK